MKKITYLTLLLAFIAMPLINAQTVIKEGSIKFELSDVKTDNEEMKMGLDMMKGMTMEMIFNESFSLTKMNMMGGMMVTQTLVNLDSKDMTMLFDMMGQKIKVVGNTDKMKKDAGKAEVPKIDVNEFKSETKEILGYNCYKVEMNVGSENEMKMFAYITPEIKASAKHMQGFEDVNLKGFPLEFTMEMGGMMTMTYTAVEVNKSVDAASFKLKDDGYELKTMEEFQQSMGSLGGGMGF